MVQHKAIRIKNKNRKIFGGDSDTLHLTTEERICSNFEGLSGSALPVAR